MADKSLAAVINSAYDLVCRNCGRDPGSEYVRANKQEILARKAIKTLG